MKKILLLLGALALAPTAAAAQEFNIFSEVQALTRAAPTLSTEGVSLSGAQSYRVIVSADSGRTLSGAGSLLCYYWSGNLGRWIRNSALDIAVTASAVRDQVTIDYVVGVGAGRLLYAASGVTVSGGTLTVTIAVQKGAGAQ